MTSIYKVLILLIIPAFLFCQEEIIISEDTDCITTQMQEAITNADLNNSTVICIRLDQRSTAIKFVCLDESIQLIDKEIHLPNLFGIELENNATITLTGTACLKGENFGGSRIVQHSPNQPVIVMEDCDNCCVEELEVSGCNFDPSTGRCIVTPGATGIVINSNSGGNNVSSVRFKSLETGIDVNESDDNEFEDLHFDDVAEDLDDCEPCEEDAGNWFCGPGAAIHFTDSKTNTIKNAVHRHSGGAITIWLDRDCDDNELINISVENEDSPCKLSAPFADPSIFIGPNSIMQTGNIILANLNGGRVVGHPSDPNAINCGFCQSNSINTIHDDIINYRAAQRCNNSSLSSCDGASASVSCSN